MTGAVRSTALRAGGACVRCRKGKTKCVYENGRAPCKNCAKGLHQCYLPSDSMAGATASRHTVHRPARESLPATGGTSSDPRAANPASVSRHIQPPAGDKLTPELLQECERVVSKTYPASEAFHKPTFVQQLKNSSLEPALVYALLTCASRSSPALIRRYGNQSGATGAAEHFASKAMSIIIHNMDAPSLADLQAICLIIIHEWGSRNAVRAYIYLGQASRMLQMYRVLHSHHVGDHGNTDRFLEDESFRRVLWLLYILDCLLTSHPGRQPALSVADTLDVSLPCLDMNFAFGNAVFVKTLDLSKPRHMPPDAQVDVVGEFGHIVLATRIWRDVVQMLLSPEPFSEDTCAQLVAAIEKLRHSLPMQYTEKPGQINLHITMGSGFTYAMLHCMLHCACIFIHRRRLLHYVTAHDFNIETWRLTPECHEIVGHLFTSCHAIIALLSALDAGSDKESILCYPIAMLFSAFTASATVAYLSLKGLTPQNTCETASSLVRDGLRFMQDGVNTWPLISSWLRHLTVMHRVLDNDSIPRVAPGGGGGGGGDGVHASSSSSSSVKDDVASNADSNQADTSMDYEHGADMHKHPSNSESGRDSEPPAPAPRRPGVTTINGGSGGIGTPAATTSPPPVQTEVKRSPESVHGQPVVSNGHDQGGVDRPVPPAPQDMTALELCVAFERQLLELDDLAAFMGGGV
ncbi:hypothetical protein SODALDRAFT_3693 [Sodiomyces alkalinus F11]|uniref:Zn(2)-C6 fungal-type domain-containing protein n=1 Tax=Sodiomyces alkalinus (strain CBS 110278 / VKM F-3762 / F11) TaxID=1314773 RepID=A0A3N2Q5F5_SODAK|nr:hypothetical protein SODALDRAFT_3693 [Sodiomyces alkalinus F11]ROT41927.1 hypothetical protein SODALDRAFT_3693 [Sodiomyces alkalinus F11]